MVIAVGSVIEMDLIVVIVVGCITASIVGAAIVNTLVIVIKNPL